MQPIPITFFKNQGGPMNWIIFENKGSIFTLKLALIFWMERRE